MAEFTARIFAITGGGLIPLSIIALVQGKTVGGFVGILIAIILCLIALVIGLVKGGSRG